MKYVLILCCLFLYLLPGKSEAACTAQVTNDQGAYIIYTGSCTEDNEALIVTGSIIKLTRIS